MNIFPISIISFIFSVLVFPSLSAQEFESSSLQLALQDQEPKPLNYPEICQRILYPPQAAHLGIEGLVQVLIQVDEEGRYSGHTVVGNSHSLLATAVFPHLPCLSFTPAFQDGKSIPGYKVLAFRFRLRSASRGQRTNKGIHYICPEPPADTVPVVNVGNP